MATRFASLFPAVEKTDRAGEFCGGCSAFVGQWTRRAGRVVGVAFGWTDGEAARLVDVDVEPDVRSEGIGTHLVAAFASAAAERGAEVLTAPVGSFFERVGFVDGIGQHRHRVSPDPSPTHPPPG